MRGRAANAAVPVSLQPFSKEALASGTIGSAVKKHLHKRREELRMYNILDNHEEQVRGRARCTRVRHRTPADTGHVLCAQLNLERRAKLGSALRAPEEAPSSEIGGESLVAAIAARAVPD